MCGHIRDRHDGPTETCSLCDYDLFFHTFTEAPTTWEMPDVTV